MDTCFEHWNSGRLTINADGHPDFSVDGPIAPGADAWFALSALLAENASRRSWTLTLGGWVHPVASMSEREVAQRLEWLDRRCHYAPVTAALTVADREGRPHSLRLPVWVNRRTGRSDMWHPHTGWRCGPARLAPLAQVENAEPMATEAASSICAA